MAKSEGIQEIVNQVAIQAVTTVMVALKDIDVGLQPATTASTTELQMQWHGRPALEKFSFNWNAKDRYNELLNSEVEVTNILKTKACELTDEEKVPVIKNWLGREGLHNS